jgi:hypothetical protein
MEIRPTGDGKLVARPTRPGWKAVVILAAFVGLFLMVMTSIKV